MGNNKIKSYTKGISWAIFASTLWGISGTILQFISQNQKIPSGWYLSVRTLLSGIILLIIGYFIEGNKMFSIFKSWRLVGWLIAYALIGLMGNLYTFYLSIQNGNAASATILQYLSPLFIVLGSLIFKHQKPLKTDIISFVIALVGVFLAITRGSISTLAIPVSALIWGILSGLTAAGYVVLPKPIQEEHSEVVVLGWGMLISGVLFNLHHPLWIGSPKITTQLVVSLGSVILIGTIFAFLSLLHSLKFAPSSVVSIVDAVQPVVTFILSIICFHLKITIAEVIGSILIVIAIYILQHYRSSIE